MEKLLVIDSISRKKAKKLLAFTIINKHDLSQRSMNQLVRLSRYEREQGGWMRCKIKYRLSRVRRSSILEKD